MDAAGHAPVPVDPTVYPVEERVGEDILQRWIVELLRPLVERWLVHQGQPSFVGADQFIYYRQFDPHQRVAPDVYGLPGVPRDRMVRSWKVWETGIVPSFALEVVSQDWEKDYAEVPHRYADLGVAELILFDPRYTERRDGVRFQCFRRTPEGRLLLIERTDADRVQSTVLGCLLRSVGIEPNLRLRLAWPPDGAELFPTAEEAERQATEAERQAREAERQAKEAERRAKEAALARLAELEAELKRRQ